MGYAKYPLERRDFPERNSMTKDSQSRAIVRAYYNAWVDGDIDTAGMLLTDAFTNLTPINNYYTPSDYRNRCASSIRL